MSFSIFISSLLALSAAGLFTGVAAHGSQAHTSSTRILAVASVAHSSHNVPTDSKLATSLPVLFDFPRTVIGSTTYSIPLVPTPLSLPRVIIDGTTYSVPMVATQLPSKTVLFEAVPTLSPSDVSNVKSSNGFTVADLDGVLYLDGLTDSSTRSSFS